MIRGMRLLAAPLPRLCYQLPEYNDAQAGAKRPRYEERPRYEADEEQAGTVTFSLISTAFFTAKVCPRRITWHQEFAAGALLHWWM